MSSNLYAENNGTLSFGGVIQTENKGLAMIFDQWNHDIINDNVPVGINMRLFRAMEGFMDKPTAHINVKRLK
jgi:hypothetical protein